MKTKFLTLAFAVMALISMNVFAGDSNGIPSDLYAHQGDIFMFRGGNKTSSPACASSDEWAINISTPTGKSMQATVMLAYTLQKAILVSGTGGCESWGDREQPVFVHLK